MSGVGCEWHGATHVCNGIKVVLDSRLLQLALLLVLALDDAPLCVLDLFLCPWLGENISLHVRDAKAPVCYAHLVMLEPFESRRGYLLPFPVGAHPELGVNLVLGDGLALYKMPHEQVVVHGLGDDLRDGRRVELDKGIVL